MEKRIPTSEKLARALEELNDPKLAVMINRARKGFYHNFEASTPFSESFWQITTGESAASIGRDSLER